MAFKDISLQTTNYHGHKDDKMIRRRYQTVPQRPGHKIFYLACEPVLMQNGRNQSEVRQEVPTKTINIW